MDEAGVLKLNGFARHYDWSGRLQASRRNGECARRPQVPGHIHHHRHACGWRHAWQRFMETSFTDEKTRTHIDVSPKIWIPLFSLQLEQGNSGGGRLSPEDSGRPKTTGRTQAIG